MSNLIRVNYTNISIPRLPFFYKIKNIALIKIGLRKNNRITKPEAFIDTGAQYCMFNKEYAQYLGIDDIKDVPKDHIIPLTGIGGGRNENVAYFHAVVLHIYKDQRHLDIKNAIVIKDIKVGFLEKDFDIGGILGVYGFLDRFSFKTNISKGYFEIDPLFEIEEQDLTKSSEETQKI